MGSIFKRIHAYLLKYAAGKALPTIGATAGAAVTTFLITHGVDAIQAASYGALIAQVVVGGLSMALTAYSAYLIHKGTVNQADLEKLGVKLDVPAAQVELKDLRAELREK